MENGNVIDTALLSKYEEFRMDAVKIYTLRLDMESLEKKADAS